MLVRIGQLVLGQIGAAFHHQAARIHRPAALPRGRFGEALGDHRRHNEIGDAGRGFAGAEEQQFLLGELGTGNAQRREDAG